MELIPDGYYVLAYSVNDHRLKDAYLPEVLAPVHDFFTGMGLPEVANVDNTIPFIAFGKKGISYYLNALTSIKEVGGQNDTLSSKIFYRLGLNYRRIGDYDNSISFFKKRLSLIDTTAVNEREQYANILNSISISYKYKDDYTNALE